MSEQRNIKYKSSWYKYYLQWVCGCVNAQGGRIYFGNDNGGVGDSMEGYNNLLEDILVPFILISNKKENIKRVSTSIVKQDIPEKTTHKQTVGFEDEDLF